VMVILIWHRDRSSTLIGIPWLRRRWAEIPRSPRCRLADQQSRDAPRAGRPLRSGTFVTDYRPKSRTHAATRPGVILSTSRVCWFSGESDQIMGSIRRGPEVLAHSGRWTLTHGPAWRPDCPIHVNPLKGAPHEGSSRQGVQTASGHRGPADSRARRWPGPGKDRGLGPVPHRHARRQRRLAGQAHAPLRTRSRRRRHRHQGRPRGHPGPRRRPRRHPVAGVGLRGV